jgi:flagellar motility protein MotE (MotC chaperone)
MMSLIRELRLIPVVLFATVCLLALKVLGIVVDGRYTLADLDFPASAPGGANRPGAAPEWPAVGATAEPGSPPRAQKPWATEMFNYPDVTGSIAAQLQAEKNAEKLGVQPQRSGPMTVNPAESKSDGTPVPLEANPVSAAERALLERLQERRLELDLRARELEIRESLLKTTEKQLEARVGELKELEARIKASTQQKDEAEAARFKNLVTMYENMKAKDAAKIFDRLELRLLLEVASQINPRRMSDILAQMQPETAERLTAELASRTGAAERGPSSNDLPKIEGRPKAQ